MFQTKLKMERLIGKKVIIEIKTGFKFFGVIKEIDSSPEHFKWIVLVDKYGKEQIISDSEIARIEVDGE